MKFFKNLLGSYASHTSHYNYKCGKVSIRGRESTVRVMQALGLVREGTVQVMQALGLVREGTVRVVQALGLVRMSKTLISPLFPTFKGSIPSVIVLGSALCMPENENLYHPFKFMYQSFK